MPPFASRLLAALALAAVAALPVRAAPALWVVKSPTATVYLFGTMHILEPDAVWRTPALTAAYDKSDTVWFETDVSSADAKTEAQTLMLQYGLDPQHPLTGKLDAEHLSELKAVLEHDGMPFDRLAVLRPWAAALLLQAIPMMKAGFDPKSGADMQLTSDAAAAHKTVRTFESIDQQLHFFADLDSTTEVQLLEDQVDESARTSDSQTKQLEATWLSGDIVTLGPLITGNMKKQYPALYEVLIRRRNQAWSETLTHELAGTGTELVNVGALHMVGDDGLPALLKAKGFTVERVQ